MSWHQACANRMMLMRTQEQGFTLSPLRRGLGVIGILPLPKPQDQEQDKDAHSHHFIQCSIETACKTLTSLNWFCSFKTNCITPGVILEIALCLCRMEPMSPDDPRTKKLWSAENKNRNIATRDLYEMRSS